MFVFQVQLDSKKVSREQMLDYLAQTSKGVSFEVSEAEARRFLSGKFEGREWFSDLMSRVRFESKLAYNFSEGSALVHLGGTYVRPQASGNFGKLMILRYPVNVDDIFDSHEFSEKLKELHGSEGAAKIISNFYKHAANSSNPFSLLDDASLTALYSLVRHHEQRAQDAVRRSLDSYVHEVGHAVLHQVVGSERYAGPDQAAVRAYLSSHVRDANYVPVVEGIEAFYLRDGILEDFGGLSGSSRKIFPSKYFIRK